MRWRMAVRLFALLAALALCVPASEGRAGTPTGHAGSAHLGLDLPGCDPADGACGDHADGAVAQHCAQCACHQALTAAAEIPVALRPAVEIRFTERTDPAEAR